jgi:hypothetical protein
MNRGQRRSAVLGIVLTAIAAGAFLSVRPAFAQSLSRSDSVGDRWSVSLATDWGQALGVIAGVPLRETQIGRFDVALNSPYHGGLWAAYAGGTVHPVRDTGARVGGFDLSGWRIDVARPLPLAINGTAATGNSAVALRWGTSLAEDWQVSFGSSITVGTGDGGSFAVTPVQSLRPIEPPNGGFRLRNVGLEGSSSLQVSDNWALLGVVGYRRPTSGPAPTGSDNFYSLLGLGYRF